MHFDLAEIEAEEASDQEVGTNTIRRKLNLKKCFNFYYELCLNFFDVAESETDEEYDQEIEMDLMIDDDIPEDMPLSRYLPKKDLKRKANEIPKGVDLH